ncbi:hypothetical protein L0Y69_00170 [bacterium]|nr:hypothetical protein [bacterium]
MNDEIKDDERLGIEQRTQGLENRLDRMYERLMDEIYAVKEKNKELERRLVVLEAKMKTA